MIVQFWSARSIARRSPLSFHLDRYQARDNTDDAATPTLHTPEEPTITTTLGLTYTTASRFKPALNTLVESLRLLTMAGKRNGTRAVGILMIAALLLAIYLQIRSDRNPPAAVIGVSSPSALPDSTSAPAEEVTVTRISHPTETRLPPTAHKKRAELEYPDYVCKGDKLMQYQSWTPQQITQDLIRKGKIPAGGSSQSQYTLITQLQANGWSKNPNNPDFNDELDFTNYLPISNVLTAMGLSTRTSANGNGGENTMVSWEHNRDVVVGGKQYWVRCCFLQPLHAYY